MTALTLAIVVFATGAFVQSQLLKQEEAPISDIEVDRLVAPGCDCPRESGELSFNLRRAQPISAAMVDEDERPVRELLDAAFRASGEVTLEWDATDDAGRVVPDGDYRLRLELAVPDRTIVIPSDVEVRSEAGTATRTTGAGEAGEVPD